MYYYIILKTIYDTSPEIRIKGSGFDADGHDIILTLGAAGTHPLKVDKDFVITKDADGIILKLIGKKK